MEIYLVGCDIDGGHHGCFSDPLKAIEAGRELLKSQPFHMECKSEDIYVETVEVDSKERELLELAEFIVKFKNDRHGC